MLLRLPPGPCPPPAPWPHNCDLWLACGEQPPPRCLPLCSFHTRWAACCSLEQLRHGGRGKMTATRLRTGPLPHTCSPPFRQALSSCLELVLGCWDCELRWEVSVCDIEQKPPPVLHSSPPQTQIDRQMDRHTKIKVPIGPRTRIRIRSSLTNACSCARRGSAHVWGLGREPGFLQPGQASPAPHWVRASLPLCLYSPMPKGVFSSLCQSIMKVHSTSKGILGGVPRWALGGWGPTFYSQAGVSGCRGW